MWFWQHLAVDVPFEDDWSSVGLLRRFDAGRMPLTMLWAQHNENRMVLPRLIVLALAGVTRMDTRWPMLLGIVLLLAAAALLVALAAGLGLRSWWWSVPAVAVLLSWVQAENLLWGFQFPWYLVLLALVAVCWLLGRDPIRSTHWGAAAALALAASLTSLQGLFLWPCGFLLLAGRGGRARQRWGWLVLSLVVTLGYLDGYHAVRDAARHAVSPLADPGEAVRYVLEAIGSVFTLPPVPTEVVGGAILLAAVAAAVGWVRLGWREPDLLAPTALLLFAALFDGALVTGRLGLGVAQAASSRYTTYDLLWLVGTWLLVAAIGRRAGWGAGGRRGRAMVAVAGLLGGVLLLQVALGYGAGWAAGRAITAARIEAAEIVTAFPDVPRHLVKDYVYPAPPRLRPDVLFLRARRYSLFGGRSIHRYLWTGVVPGGIPGRPLPDPPGLSAQVTRTVPGHAAWTVLSSLVDRLHWLRARFVTHARAYPLGLLLWATGPGLGRHQVWLYLAPVRPELRRLLAALERSRNLAAITRGGARSRR